MQKVLGMREGWGTMLTLADNVGIFAKNIEFAARGSGRWLAAQLSSPWVHPNQPERIIFVHVPKAAGTSIATALFGQTLGHRPLSRYVLADRQKAASAFKFAFVRNPWDRLASAYFYFSRVRGQNAHRDHRWATQMLPDSFREFGERLADERYRKSIMRYDHFRPQYVWLQECRGIGVDFIGRFEVLRSDFAEICRAVGVESTLPHFRKSSNESYAANYTPQMVAIVADMYKEDVRRFGFEFPAVPCSLDGGD